MFRQKIAEVTNCTCRLIPNEKNDFSIFRAPVHAEKSAQKDHKQKYSLKTQTISSGKTDPKNISAKKTNSKLSKLSQDDRISITGNVDSQKKKLDRYKICLPDAYAPRNFDETVTSTGSLPKAQNNFSKGAYVFKTKEENKLKEQSKPHGELSNYKTFGALKKFTIAHQNAKAISTSCASSQKNKQNAFKAGNLVNDERTNQKTDKSLKKIRDLVENRLPLNQVSLNLNHQFTHGSLQKYEKAREQSSRFNNISSYQTSGLFEVKNKQLGQNNFQGHRSPDQDNSRIKIGNFKEKTTIVSRNVSRGEYSQSEQFKNFLNNMRSNSVEKLSGDPTLTNRSSVSIALSNHKRAHTFNDLMGQKKLSESILSDEQQKESENSIVVMTFKDLIEKNKAERQKEAEDEISKLSFIKSVNSNEVHKASILTSESDLMTKLKPYQVFKSPNSLF